MDVVDKRTGAEFDHHAPEFGEAGGAERMFRDLRDRCPVQHTPASGGFSVATTFDEVSAAARQPETFSSILGNNVPDRADEFSAEKKRELLRTRRERAPGLLIHMDPPRHGVYRRMLNPSFSAANVAGFEQRLRELSRDQIATFVKDGQAEVFGMFAQVVPAIVNLEFLGLPTDDWQFRAGVVVDRFQNAAGQTSSTTDSVDVELVGRVIADRRAEPRDDVISVLAASTVDGEPLSDRDIITMVSMIVVAGLDTTASSVATSLVLLDQMPDLRRQLAETDDSKVWETGVDELLRLVTPVQLLRRTVAHDTVLGGVPLSTGDRVMLAWAAANRDPAAFPDPDEFRFDRPNGSRHMSFGFGPHKCIGMHLARLEVRVMLQEFLAAIPEFVVERDGLQVNADCALVRSYKRVPITFDTTTVGMVR